MTVPVYHWGMISRLHILLTGLLTLLTAVLLALAPVAVKAGGCSENEKSLLRQKYATISGVKDAALQACPDQACINNLTKGALSYNALEQLLAQDRELTEILGNNYAYGIVHLRSQVLNETYANVTAINNFVADHCAPGDVACVDKAQAAWLLGTFTVATGVLSAPNVVGALSVCIRNPSCLSELAIGIGEASAADALAGGSLAMVPKVTAAGGVIFLRKGDDIIRVISAADSKVYQAIGKTEAGDLIVTAPNGSAYAVNVNTGKIGDVATKGGVGFDDLAKFRKDLGLPPAGSAVDKSTLAVIEVNGQKIYGVNAHGQPVTGVNAISATHAEIDALNQIKQQGIDVSGKSLTLHVDRTPCAACGPNGGIRSMVEQLELKQLTVVGPDGPMIITPR